MNFLQLKDLIPIIFLLRN